MSDDGIDNAAECELIKPAFVNDFPRLPATGPTDHAHIINDLCIFKQLDQHRKAYDFQIQDATCTLLFKMSPETLSMFLSGSTKTFKLIQWNPDFPGRYNIVIWRRGHEILVGVIQSKDDDLFHWANSIRCQINLDGSWKVTEVTFGQHTAADWDDVWNNKVIKGVANGPSVGKVIRNQKNKESCLRNLGYSLLFNNRWKPEKSKWKIEIT